MSEITINQYAGSVIEKGFQSEVLEEAKVVENVVGTFQKGLIGNDVFEKAIEEVNLLKGQSAVGTAFEVSENSKVEKTEKGWELIKAKSGDDESDEEEEEVEKAKGEDDDLEKIKKGDSDEEVASGGDTKEPGEVEDEDE